MKKILLFTLFSFLLFSLDSSFALYNPLLDGASDMASGGISTAKDVMATPVGYIIWLEIGIGFLGTMIGLILIIFGLGQRLKNKD